MKYRPRGKKEFIWNIPGKVGQKKRKGVPGSLRVFQPSHACLYYYLSLTFKAIHTRLLYTRNEDFILELRLK